MPMIAHDVACEIPAPRHLEAQLDRAALLLLYAQPERKPYACPTPAAPTSLELRNSLRRMEATPRRPSRAYGLRVAQFTGERAGNFSALGTLHSSKPAWKSHENAIPFDGQHSWWVSLSECRFELGAHWTFSGCAMGQTYPLLQDGRTVTMLDAVGTLSGVSERARGLEGVFSMNGRLTADGGFEGTICCRIPDPTGVLLRDREVPALEAQRDPDPETTLLVVRASGWSNAAAQQPSGDVHLAGTAEIRAAEYTFTPNAHPGLRASVLLGPPLGKLDVDLAANLSARGQAGNPAEFSAQYDYRFLDEDGDEVASLRARALDGRMFDFAMAGASQIRTIAYAGTGPVVSGSGHLIGARGQFSVLGTRSAGPPAFVDTSVISLLDPGGRLRVSGCEGHSVDASAPSPLQRFLPMVAKLDEYSDKHREWRWAFRKRSEIIANTIAAKYNELRNVAADFEGIPMDAALLRTSLEAKIAPFNPTVFERYGGPARGQFRFYSHASRQETGGNVLYSYWNPATFRFGARYCKFITGSFQRYIRPDQVPDFSTHQFDPIVNSYRDDLGVVSYILVYQNKAPGLYQERTSIAYKMPGPHEVLWFVKDLFVDGKPAPPDIFMSSHEWKEVQGTRTRYLLVGMFWRIDFDRGSIELADDMFWRALYEEEQGQV